MTGFQEISQNADFCLKMAIFWPKKAKAIKTGFFWQFGFVTSVALESPKFVPKSEQSYE